MWIEAAEPADRNPAARRPIIMTDTTTALSPVLAEHIRAVNAFDLDAITATFA